jgi:hypothetical protein
MPLQIVIGRSGVRLALQRHRQESRGLVHHHQRVVFVQDRNVARLHRGPRPPLRAAGPIHPHADDVAGAQQRARLAPGGLFLVDEDLALVERIDHAAARSQSLAGGEELIEPRPRSLGGNDPRGAVRLAIGAPVHGMEF